MLRGFVKEFCLKHIQGRVESTMKKAPVAESSGLEGHHQVHRDEGAVGC